MAFNINPNDDVQKLREDFEHKLQVNRKEDVQRAQRQENQYHLQDSLATANKQELLKRENLGKSDKTIELEAPSTTTQPILNSQRAPSIIALLSEVIALQTQASSKTWQLMWEGSQQSMTNELKMGALSASLAQSSAQSQANSIIAKANGQLYGGIAMAAATGLTLMTSALSGGIRSALGKVTQEEAVAAEQQTQKATAAAMAKTEEQTASTAAKSEGSGAASEKETKIESNRSSSILKNLKSLWNNKNGSKIETGLAVGNAVQTGLQLGQVPQMFTSSEYGKQEAQYEKDKGVADSAKVRSDTSQTWYQQNVSRQQEQSNSAQGFVTSLVDMLTQASNTVTSTVGALFRG